MENTSLADGKAASDRYLELRYSQSVQDLSWSALLGLVIAVDLDSELLQRELAGFQGPLEGYLLQNATCALDRIHKFEEFFEKNQFRCPLRKQWELTCSKGLPIGNAAVQLLLLSEMSAGLLMGAQDAAAIKGPLIYDLSGNDEGFRGMRGKIRCRRGELVLRDQEGIIASLFQGPDHRTRMTEKTRNIIFLIFAAPDINVSDVKEGVENVKQRIKTSCSRLYSEIHKPGERISGA